MKYVEVYGTPFPLLEFELEKGETIKYQPSAMVYADDGVDIDIQWNRGSGGKRGGLLKAVARSIVSGESLLIMHVTGRRNGGKIGTAPCQAGEVVKLDIGKEQWKMRDGTFFACEEGIDFKITTQSLGKALFAGTGGLFIQETVGEGAMYIEACGKMVRKDLASGEKLLVDNSHLVAWSTNMDYKTRLFDAGEFITLEFVGPGSVIIQTNCRNSTPKSANDN